MPHCCGQRGFLDIGLIFQVLCQPLSHAAQTRQPLRPPLGPLLQPPSPEKRSARLSPDGFLLLPIRDEGSCYIREPSLRRQERFRCLLHDCTHFIFALPFPIFDGFSRERTFQCCRLPR